MQTRTLCFGIFGYLASISNPLNFYLDQTINTRVITGHQLVGHLRLMRSNMLLMLLLICSATDRSILAMPSDAIYLNYRKMSIIMISLSLPYNDIPI